MACLLKHDFFQSHRQHVDPEWDGEQGVNSRSVFHIFSCCTVQTLEVAFAE